MVIYVCASVCVCLSVRFYAKIFNVDVDVEEEIIIIISKLNQIKSRKKKSSAMAVSKDEFYISFEEEEEEKEYEEEDEEKHHRSQNWKYLGLKLNPNTNHWLKSIYNHIGTSMLVYVLFWKTK